MIIVARVYDDQPSLTGDRYLVERLWPRGIRKSELNLTAWFKEVAPSTELRKWYSHDPDKWPEFRRRYRAELDANPETWKPLLDAAKKGDITLLYSARDRERNSAIVLKEYIESKL